MDRPEEEFVISWNNDFVWVWQFAEPGVEVSNRVGASGEHAEVPGVNQDVDARHLPSAMQFMSIADQDEL
jgi:hypothetical protein